MPHRQQGAFTALLDETSMAAYLRRRRLVRRGEQVIVTPLGGGVSNSVFKVLIGKRAVVVKQALPRLRVADEWYANRERSVTEALALRLVSAITPGAVPGVLDVDPVACAVTIAAAPDTWIPWKDQLLRAHVSLDVATSLGTILAAWNTAVRTSPALLDAFWDREVFDQLRIDPFYRTVALRHPAIAAQALALADDYANGGPDLVHGDFSPKNVLVGPDGLWVIDFEVAHAGHVRFDVAYLVSHLVLKQVHVGKLGFQQAASAFLAAYRTGCIEDGSDARTAQHVACLLLARVDGKSPAEYLDERGRTVVRAAALSLMAEPPGSIDEVWARVEQASA